MSDFNTGTPNISYFYNATVTEVNQDGDAICIDGDNQKVILRGAALGGIGPGNEVIIGSSDDNQSVVSYAKAKQGNIPSY